MGYRLVCDRCGDPIDPTSSKIVVGYDMDSWNEPKERYELCASCARTFKQWMEISYPTVTDEKGSGEGDN